MSVAVRDVVVIGGGIAGLAAAHRVRERDAGARVTVLEAGDRLGGAVWTDRVPGFVVEGGADSFLTEKRWAMGLARRLGLEDRLIRTRDEQRRTFIVHAGALHPLPDGFLMMAPTKLAPLLSSRLFSPAGKLRMALDLVLPRRSARDDESLDAFVRRRLGREALERAAQPLVGGIYTADPTRLSLAATMPRFIEMERQQRSIILAMRRQAKAAARSDSGARWSLFASFADGMQTLVDALARRLPEGAVRLGTRVTGVERTATGGWRIALAHDEALEASQIVLATPAFVSAELVRPLDPTLADRLASIRHASSAIVTLGYARTQVPHPLDGFGFVVPAVEGRRIIAGTFSSVKYAGRAPAEHALLRVFMGGALAEHMALLPDDALVGVARSDLGALLGVTGEPALIRIARHPRAMPQYDLGHLERVDAIEAAVGRLGGLALAGNAYRGVGIPDCIHSGERAVDSLFDGVLQPA
ncbi:MAG: protoporphyrinogen oxidase [Candidatus Binatia bacterium]